MTHLGTDRVVTDARGEWRQDAGSMLFRAFLAQNVAVGCAFGSFGVTVLALQQRFGASLGTISLATALVVLMMGLTGPVVAALIARIGLRWTMMIGLLLSLVGYVALAFASTMTVVLVVYGLLVGPGTSMLGPLPASMLAGGWYPDKRGRSVGIANIPLLVAIAPLAGMAIIQGHGLAALYASMAVLHIMLLPFLIGIRDAPDSRVNRAAAADEPASDLMRRPMFWLLVAGGGVLNATSIVGISHNVSIGIEKGLSSAQAVVLGSVMGGSSIVGSMLIGALCDKLGGGRALALIALGFAGSWFVLAWFSWLPLMIAAMLLLGACGAGVFPAVNVVAAHAWPIAFLPRAVGLIGFFTLPFTFLLPPAAALLRDRAGEYDGMMTSIMIACALVCASFLVGARNEGRTAARLAGRAS